MVLGSFFYGYVVSQLLGGLVTDKFGGKWVFGIGTFIAAILALCSPFAAKCGIWVYITLRIIQGLSVVNLVPGIGITFNNYLP